MYRQAAWGWQWWMKGSGAVAAGAQQRQMFRAWASIMKLQHSRPRARQRRGPEHPLPAPRSTPVRASPCAMGCAMALFWWPRGFQLGCARRRGSLASTPPQTTQLRQPGFPACPAGRTGPLSGPETAAGPGARRGIQRVRGRVWSADPPVFNSLRPCWPDGLIAPIWVNGTCSTITVQAPVLAVVELAPPPCAERVSR